jgi:MarR family transcriptional regulator, transcriptional regulator for hemolysin
MDIILHATITPLIILRVSETPDLLFLLHDVARLLRHESDRRARAHGMTRAQWVILFWLQRQPGLSQKELSEILEVEPITVARLVDRLEARGMVERRPDPKDRRIWRLHLLPPGEPVLAELFAEKAAIRDMATAHIDEATQSIMLEGLSRMKATLVGECRHKQAAREPAKAVA